MGSQKREQAPSHHQKLLQHQHHQGLVCSIVLLSRQRQTNDSIQVSSSCYLTGLRFRLGPLVSLLLL